MKSITANQIQAIAKLTLKENLRSKVFWILLLTGVAFNSIAILLPVVGDSADKLEFVESMCLKSITFFGMLTGAILSSTSIPKDIEDKSIFSIITKPVKRLNLFLGKVLGFIYIVGLTILFLGCFSVVVIRSTASGHTAKHTLSRNGNNIESSGKIAVVSENDGSSLLIARKPTENVNLSFRGVNETSNEEVKWIEGDKATAILTITLNNKMRDKDIEVELNYYIEGDETSIPLKVTAMNSALQHKETRTVVAYIDKKLTLSFDRQLTGESDQLIIEFEPLNEGHFIGLKNKNIKVFYDSAIFEYNFIKAITIILFQVILIIFIGVTGSTFLITPAVSISFVMFMFFCGYMVDYLKDFESALSFQGVHTHHGHEHEMETVATAPGILLTFLDLALKHIFDFITFTFPNLNKFNVESFIIDRIDIPLKRVASLFCYSLIYLISFAGISSVIVRKKEI